MFDSLAFRCLMVAAIAAFAIKAAFWRTGAKRGLILELLLKHGPLTSLELRDKGGGALVYNYLLDLEKEGLIDRVSDEQKHPERGGRPRIIYSIARVLRG